MWEWVLMEKVIPLLLQTMSRAQFESDSGTRRSPPRSTRTYCTQTVACTMLHPASVALSYLPVYLWTRQHAPLVMFTKHLLNRLFKKTIAIYKHFKRNQFTLSSYNYINTVIILLWILYIVVKSFMYLYYFHFNFTIFFHVVCPWYLSYHHKLHHSLWCQQVICFYSFPKTMKKLWSAFKAAWKTDFVCVCVHTV